jgi:hypothetical protein
VSAWVSPTLLPVHPAEHLFLEALRRGDEEQLNTLHVQATPFSADVFRCEPSTDRRDRWHLAIWMAAARSPRQAALTWLRIHRPELVPQGPRAVNALAASLEGHSRLSLRTADWLVAHTDLVAAVQPYHASMLTRAAIKRPSVTAVRWLLKPPAPMKPWINTSDAPLLLAIVQALGTAQRDLFDDLTLAQVTEAQNQGIQDLPAYALLTRQPVSHTALTWVASVYRSRHLAAQRQTNTDTPLPSDFEARALALWCRLIEGGSNLQHRRQEDGHMIASGGHSALEDIAGFPLAITHEAHARLSQGHVLRPTGARRTRWRA